MLVILLKHYYTLTYIYIYIYLLRLGPQSIIHLLFYSSRLLTLCGFSYALVLLVMALAQAIRGIVFSIFCVNMVYKGCHIVFKLYHIVYIE